MTAIFTKYIPASNTKPARIKVFPGNGGKGLIISKSKLENLIEGKRLEITDERIAKEAAIALCEKMKWEIYPWKANGPKLASGGTKEGFVFVFVD